MTNDGQTRIYIYPQTVHGKMYSIQHYEIKFVSDLRQVCGFVKKLHIPPPIKRIAMI
jgi:hypothetical protein